MVDDPNWSISSRILDAENQYAYYLARTALLATSYCVEPSRNLGSVAHRRARIRDHGRIARIDAHKAERLGHDGREITDSAPTGGTPIQPWARLNAPVLHLPIRSDTTPLD